MRTSLDRSRGGRAGSRIGALLIGAAIAMVLTGSLAWAQSSSTPAESPPTAPATRAADVGLLVAWYDLQLVMMRETPGFTPPVAARALGYVGVAAWEALAPSLEDGLSLAGRLNAFDRVPAPPLEGYDGPVAVSSAIAGTVRGMYPNAFAAHLAAVEELEAAVEASHSARIDDATLARSRAFGRAVAGAVLDWAATDGGHDAHQGGFFGFAPSPDPGAWIPTPRNNGPPFPPLHPQWGENRPMALAAADTCAAPPPPPYSEAAGSPLYGEALEVYETVGRLTPQQRDTALFWADDPGQTSTPAGHWASILGSALREEETDLGTAVEAYARLGIAVNDAFIACWNTKYLYNLLRPITYIQRVIDPAWNAGRITDPVITPPFPEYTSGHSVVSGAAATALTHVLGIVAFDDPTHVHRGMPARRYDSFQHAAEEAAISRLYGGIHFRSAIEAGLAQGACVGDRVAALAFRATTASGGDRTR